MKPLVRLRTRPSRDGRTFKYFLDYKDENGKRRQLSLGHADGRKANRQRDKKERELRMGITEQQSMRLSTFLHDSERRSRGHVCEGNLVERGQLENNPFRYVRKRKAPRRRVRIYAEDECGRLIRSAKEFFGHSTWTPCVPWDLIIIVALCTHMRRGELLNTTWGNIDFSKQTVDVSPKTDTDQTWEWHIKDADRRTCLEQWLRAGLTEYDVMNLAGHADFNTTHRFYLSVRDDLLQRARAASAEAMNNDFVAHLLRTSSDVQYSHSQKTGSALNEMP